MTPRDLLIRDLLLQGSYSKHDLSREVGRIMNRKPWSIAAIEASLKTLPVSKDGNPFMII